MVMLLPVVAMAGQPDRAQLLRFDIPKQAADKALIEFAEQAGVTFIFPADKAAKVTANAVRGEFTPQEALDRLLDGTGLTSRYSEGGSLAVCAGNDCSNRGDSMKKRGFQLGKIFAAVSAALAAGMSSYASAQSTDGLEEIVVTAQKRQENMQEVPISVSAMTSSQIERAHAFTLEGLQGMVPNLQVGHFSSTPRSAVVNIRGVGTSIDPHISIGNTVSIVNDGVPQAFNSGALGDLFDVERIEVLRGPQGTLFGANTIGGVVSVVNKQPTGEYGGTANVSVGNYNRLDGNVAVDFPIVEDKLAGKVVLMHHGQDGFYTNVVNGQTAGDVDTTALRAYLKYTGSDSFDATLAFEMVESNSGSPAFAVGAVEGDLLHLVEPGTVTPGNTLPMYRSPCTSNDRPCKAPKGRFFTANSQVPDISDYESYAPTLTMNWNLGSHQITSITGYKKFEIDEYVDQDVSPAYGSSTHQPSDAWQFSQEVRDNMELSDRFRLLVGGFYMKTAYDHQQNYNMNQFVEGLRQNSLSHGDSWSASLFGQGYFDITDKLRLQVGGRYTHERSELDVSVDYYMNFVYDEEGNIIGVAPSTFGPGDTYLGAAGGSIVANGSKSWDLWAGKIGLDYRMNEDVMFYGLLAHGFKSGGFFGRITVPQDIGPYEPAYVDSLEAGIKTELLDRRIRLNLSAFLNKYEDMQVANIYRYEDDQGRNLNGNSIVNAAKSEIKGFELEIQARVTDGLTLNGSIAYLDAEYTKFDYVDPVTGADGDPNNDIIFNLKGTALTQAPEWGATASAVYEIPVGPGNLSTNLQYRYTSGQYFTNPQNLPRSYVQATRFIDANIDWSPNDDNWTISLWARNLEDNHYVASVFHSAGYGSYVGYYPPREYGMTLEYRF